MSAKFEKMMVESKGLKGIEEFVEEWETSREKGVPNFEDFENEIHKRIMELEKELIMKELERYDVKKKK